LGKEGLAAHNAKIVRNPSTANPEAFTDPFFLFKLLKKMEKIDLSTE
jgi:hypothetical protein